MSNLKWLKDLKKKTGYFLKQISEKNFSHISYSLNGDLYGNSIKWGLGQFVFMSKILYMLDLLKRLQEVERDNLISNIKSFQTEDGYISDPLIIRLITKKRFFFLKDRSNIHEIEKIKRAETRQSFSALNCLGEKPDRPFLHIPYTIDGIDKFLSGLDWKYPWDAGSHFSHLMFFLKMNKEMFAYQDKVSDELINYTNEKVDELQSGSDGFWYSEDTTQKEKINGAMKILTGKSAAGITYIDMHEKIIDNCLGAINDHEACSNFNIIYCLYYCSGISDYKRREIEKFCIDRLKIYWDFYFEKTGGFSFYKNRANDIYYGAQITKGLKEPDIHGTVMFIWGIALISKILDFDFIDLNIPLT